MRVDWSKCKSFIKGLLPYSYILKREYRRRTFIPMLDSFEKNNNFLLPQEESKFRHIISVEGFGYSGSGAVLDLLREYNIAVLGYVSLEGSKTNIKDSLSEIEILRLSGGFFEIEKYLETDNVFLNSAALNRMIRLFETSVLYHYDDEIKSFFVSFFYSLLDFRITDLSRTYYNPHLTRYDEKSSIFFMKKHTLTEFRQKCSNLLNLIFNRIQTENTILAVDQLCSDLEFNLERNLEYIKNLKTIIVTRDPRDLYVWARLINCEWIAHNNVDDFITWYEITYKNIPQEDGNYLIIAYENLIWDYDNSVSKIEDYLGLSSDSHMNKLSCFDPKLSSKYTKLYKNHPEYNNDIEKIKIKLNHYCNSIID